MATHVTLICQATTRAMRVAAFPDPDEPLDQRGEQDAAEAARAPPKADRTWTSPALAARQTASALGFDAGAEAALRDCDHGRWTGRRLAELQAEEPDALAAWLSDPAAAPHGGETVLDVLGRVGAWLDAQAGQNERLVAVTHASVIRAAVVHAIRATPASCLRIDVAPLSSMALSFHGQWRLRAAGVPLGAAKILWR